MEVRIRQKDERGASADLTNLVRFHELREGAKVVLRLAG